MFKNILVPTDLTAISGEALSVAVDLARQHGSRLTLVYVLPDFRYAMVEQYFPPDFETHATEEAKEALSKYMTGFDLTGISCDIVIRTGRIYEEIVKLAHEQKNDLVVIATRSPHGLEHFLMGSNAEKITRYVHCSVLVVRQGGNPPSR